MSVNNKFRDHVTSTAFHLSLSNNMIATMVMISRDQWLDGGARRFYFNGRDNWSTSYRSLEDRGLAEYNEEARTAIKVKWVFRLTKAGELTLELLKEAGLVVEYQPEKEDERT